PVFDIAALPQLRLYFVQKNFDSGVCFEIVGDELLALFFSHVDALRPEPVEQADRRNAIGDPEIDHLGYSALRLADIGLWLTEHSGRCKSMQIGVSPGLISRQQQRIA